MQLSIGFRGTMLIRIHYHMKEERQEVAVVNLVLLCSLRIYFSSNDDKRREKSRHKKTKLDAKKLTDMTMICIHCKWRS